MNEIECGQLCSSTIKSLYIAAGGLKNFPGLLKKVITTQAWKRRINKGRLVELNSLRELITEKPPTGWGEDTSKVEAVIKDDPEAVAMYQEAMSLETPLKALGANQHSEKEPESPTRDTPSTGCNNITPTQQVRGTGTSYTVKRFLRDITDEQLPQSRRDELQSIYDRIKAGELSVNKGAIQAGYRRQKTKLQTAFSAFLKLSPDEVVAFDQLRQDHVGGAA